jgi:hypothetical protein
MEKKKTLTDKINIPYYKAYATDLITYKLRLSSDQIVNAQTAISEICLYGETSYRPEGIEKMYFDKLHKDLKSSIPNYKASVINGGKGGRPKEKKHNPQDNPQDNLNYNPQANQSKTITIPIAKNKIDIAIDDFINHRKTLKRPMTKKAIDLLKAKLNKLATTDQDKIDILNQSIENGWIGVFALKEKKESSYIENRYKRS